MIHADSAQLLPGVPAAATAHWASAAAEVAAHPVHRMAHRTEAVERARSERLMTGRIQAMDRRLGNQSLEMLPEYGVKLRLLKSLEFVSDSDVRPAPLPHLRTCVQLEVSQ